MKTRYFNIALSLVLMTLVTLSATAQIGQTQYSRPMSSDGLTVFESDKSDQKSFDGLALYWGAGFTQQFQMLSHENSGAVELLELARDLPVLVAPLVDLDVDNAVSADPAEVGPRPRSPAGGL